MSKRKINRRFKHGYSSEGRWKKEMARDKVHKKMEEEELNVKLSRVK
jgi:hypothetical protein